MLKAKVLIIDEDLDLLDELTDMLTCCGYVVVNCSRAEEAVSAARVSAPDVMLVDMFTPEREGLKLIDRIKADEQTARIPVIITSGYCSEIEGRDLARAKGLAGFIRKPMNPLEVISEIERHVD